MPRLGDLGQHRLDEGLAAEAGLDGHEQQQVDLSQDRGDRRQRSGRAQSKAGPGPEPVQLIDKTEGSCRRLHMGSYDRAPHFSVLRRPAIGLFDHEVGVHWKFCMRQNGLDQRRPAELIGHKMIVHDIDVQAIRPRDTCELFGQVRLIGVEDGGVDGGTGHVVLLMISRTFAMPQDSGDPSQQRAEHGIRAFQVRPQLKHFPIGPSGWMRRNAGGDITRMKNLNPSAVPLEPLDHVAHNVLGLQHVRRAGRVRHYPSGTYSSQCAGQQLALQSGELGDVLGLAPPPGLGTTAQ